MIATSTATIYMLSSLSMGLITFFAVLIILFLMAKLVHLPLNFFWGKVIKGLLKRQ